MYADLQTILNFLYDFNGVLIKKWQARDKNSLFQILDLIIIMKILMSHYLNVKKKIIRNTKMIIKNNSNNIKTFFCTTVNLLLTFLLD